MTNQRCIKGRTLGEIATLPEIPEDFKGITDIEKIDVIWYDEAVPPSYLFEVDTGGTIRNALHRLYQARHLHTKFFVVSPEQIRSDFERWVTTAPYRSIKNRYNFRTFKELVSLYNSVVKANQLKKRFGIS